MPYSPTVEKWRSENVEKLRSYRRKWNENNKGLVSEMGRKWRAKNPEKVRAHNERNNKKTPYGERVSKNPRKYWGYALFKYYRISLEDYDLMVKSQMGLCAICSEPGSLCVDHNHKTGMVRGLLCARCNVAIGFAKEDVSRLERMIVYLKKQEKN